VPPGFTSAQFVSHLLEHAGVSLTPGTVFGQQGEGFVRIALSSPDEQIEAAMQRIQSVL
jgi:LL-diaminopimelate aminotransferase